MGGVISPVCTVFVQFFFHDSRLHVLAEPGKTLPFSQSKQWEGGSVRAWARVRAHTNPYAFVLLCIKVSIRQYCVLFSDAGDMDIDLLQSNFYCFKLIIYIRHTLSQHQSTVYSFIQPFHFRMERYIFSIHILLFT